MSICVVFHVRRDDVSPGNREPVEADVAIRGLKATKQIEVSLRIIGINPRPEYALGGRPNAPSIAHDTQNDHDASASTLAVMQL